VCVGVYVNAHGHDGSRSTDLSPNEQGTYTYTAAVGRLPATTPARRRRSHVFMHIQTYSKYITHDIVYENAHFNNNILILCTRKSYVYLFILYIYIYTHTRLVETRSNHAERIR